MRLGSIGAGLAAWVGGALRRHTLGGARTIRNNEIGHRVYLVKGDNGAAGARMLGALAMVRSEADETKAS
jgi:hypothetical protein